MKFETYILLHVNGCNFYRSKVKQHNSLYSEKYEQYYKHRRTLNELWMRDIRLKTAKVVSEQKFLRETFIRMKETQSKISEADYIQVALINKNKKQDYLKRTVMEKEVRSTKSEYCVKI